MALNDPQSRYRQLAEVLRTAIVRGDYPPGSTMPTEPELADRYRVSRQTVNRAVAILRQEGLVQTSRGHGSTVRAIPTIRRNANARYAQAAREAGGARGAFDGEIRRLGLVPRSDVEVSRVIPPAEVAGALDIPADMQVIMRKRHMYANDHPVQLAPSYLPLDIAAGTQLEEQDSGPGGIVSRYKDLGFEQVTINETVRVRRSTEEERQFLLLDHDTPVLEIFHTGWTAERRCVEVCIHSVNAYGWQLDYAWPTG